MSINITIVANGTQDDIADYIRHVATQVDEGHTSGYVDLNRHWETDDYADDDIDRAKEGA